jgi:hypothetical protein
MSRFKSKRVIAGLILAEFAAVALLLLRWMPGPRNSTDYVVIGTLATFVALATLFGVLLASVRDSSVFVKKRDRPPAPDPGETAPPGAPPA